MSATAAFSYVYTNLGFEKDSFPKLSYFIGFVSSDSNSVKGKITASLQLLCRKLNCWKP